MPTSNVTAKTALVLTCCYLALLLQPIAASRSEVECYVHQRRCINYISSQRCRHVIKDCIVNYADNPLASSECCSVQDCAHGQPQAMPVLRDQPNHYTCFADCFPGLFGANLTETAILNSDRMLKSFESDMIMSSAKHV